MIYCSRCGAKNEDGARFCVYCGYDLLVDNFEENESHKLNYYEILEITSDASPEIIKAAYKTLVKKMHPDNGNINPDCRRTIQDINIAYDVLSNPQKRRQYDESLKLKYNSFNERVYEDKSTKEEYNEKSNVIVQSNYIEYAVRVVGSLFVFILFNHFQFNVWVLVITAIIVSFLGGEFLEKFISRIVIKRFKVDLNKDQQEEVQGMISLMILMLFFHYLNIDNWLTRLCLGALIIEVVLCVMTFVKLVVNQS